VLLWELVRLHPELGPYVPKLAAARQIPRSPDPQTGHPRKRRRALRRLEPAVVEDFIDAERPSGTIDSSYARIVETLRKQGLEDLAELASHVTNDGMLHFRRLLRLQRVLTAYRKNQYLRPLRLNGPDQAADATNMFREITEHITFAYKKLAKDDYGAARPRLDDAIRRMPQLLELSDRYAARGLGIPYWWPPS
jgi:hypothetical protein